MYNRRDYIAYTRLTFEIRSLSALTDKLCYLSSNLTHDRKHSVVDKNLPNLRRDAVVPLVKSIFGHTENNNIALGIFRIIRMETRIIIELRNRQCSY